MLREPLTDERRCLLVALRRMEACRPGRRWLRDQPMSLTLRQLWDTCPMSTWLAWLVLSAGLIRHAEYMDIRLLAVDVIRDRFDFWRVAQGLMEEDERQRAQDEPYEYNGLVRLTLHIRPDAVLLEPELL